MCYLAENDGFIFENGDAAEWQEVETLLNKFSSEKNRTLTAADAEMEIVAQTIGEEFFSDENALASLATQNRSLFQRFKQWVERNLYQTVRGGIHKEMSAEKAAKQTYRLLLRAQQAAKKNTATQGDGEKFSANSTDIVDLTGSKELSNRVAGIRGSERYKRIQEFILSELGKGDIKLSDGKIAVVDNSDASHIAHRSYNKKTTYISEIKQIVEKAKLFAEERNVEHDKFDYFCYYKVEVKYGQDTFPIFLNVGKGINDKKYHIYDITQKIRDTANQINGLERPKPNEGYALEAVSNNSISNSYDNVKRSVKKSDIVADLVGTYNYTQETANKVFANAYNLKKKTGSKADVQEISAIIANALEKRRNGNFGEEDITAVADLIASGSKTENEMVTEEAKPILDYLKGTKITLSDTDVSDLGESFTNARGKLFPYVTLSKQGGISVDSLYNND